jgi:hypothetical protein
MCMQAAALLWPCTASEVLLLCLSDCLNQYCGSRATTTWASATPFVSYISDAAASMAYAVGRAQAHHIAGQQR